MVWEVVKIPKELVRIFFSAIVQLAKNVQKRKTLKNTISQIEPLFLSPYFSFPQLYSWQKMYKSGKLLKPTKC
jgi:hypothetical protein